MYGVYIEILNRLELSEFFFLFNEITSLKHDITVLMIRRLQVHVVA